MSTADAGGLGGNHRSILVIGYLLIGLPSPSPVPTTCAVRNYISQAPLPVPRLLGLRRPGRVDQWGPRKKAGGPEVGEKPAISSSFSASFGGFPSAPGLPCVIPAPGVLVPSRRIWIFGSGPLISCAPHPWVGVGGAVASRCCSSLPCLPTSGRFYLLCSPTPVLNSLLDLERVFILPD